ncbi:alkaline-phosphatase-like protein [Emericellopsis atlantica]|uniref:GPI ethanolamine phosphate transferase 2 n=1 Tax=Emericellopsis atlantica TaxID=2614577 RepID=A0A9P7ZIK6_9HYPO|nr:alkaline-phosphatase-like protein [Emericellopsis atlantica]KAG9252784.1 alkaline-phosphatase-like protein [Emericellopsis atlantica]
MVYQKWLTGALLAIANALIPLSLIVFATGFFPYKPFLPGLAQYEDLAFGPPPEGPFDKIVFMVIDALRSDFVYSGDSGFQFTQQLIRDGKAIPFTANARSPTVTMPKIKSITTGSVPSFVDLILNIDEGDKSSSLAAQDTWLAQLKSKDIGKLVMYGDDTWLKLFPDTFDRADGTSSFFVADFTEVDHNVTRNIPAELDNDDWGLMVLHYLGLDHIGHKSGPRSVNMVPKQKEMDGIIRDIYGALETKEHLQSTLFVVCGDHGMNDAGNHGASSPGETSPALLFMSPGMASLGISHASPTEPHGEFAYYGEVEQSDIAPTIAGLMGFPVSKNNLGAFIPEFLPFWFSSEDQVQILMRNARQILQIVTATFGAELFDPRSTIDPCALEGTTVNALACEWRRLDAQAAMVAKGELASLAWVASTIAWLRESQSLMSSMASNYNMLRLYLGTGLALTAACLTLSAVYVAPGQPSEAGFLSMLLVTVPYGLMMFASSFVEEEHHFWYWASTLWLAYLGSREIRRSHRTWSLLWPVAGLAILRLLRAWNQTGQKFAGAPDIVKTFIVPQPVLLWVPVIAMYSATAMGIFNNLDVLPPFLRATFAVATMFSALAFKLRFTAEDAPELEMGMADLVRSIYEVSLPANARFTFGLLGVGALLGVYQSLVGNPRGARYSARLFHSLYAMLAMTQSRATNIPILLLSAFLLRHLQSLHMSGHHITITCILLQFVTFFAYGGTNAVSSVDLSSAYNGIDGFNVGAVGVLTFLSNWAGPVFWTTGTNILLVERFRRGDRGVLLKHIMLATLFTTISVAFVMAACTALRTHLFIWTVFSPKYLYCVAWSLGQHLVVNVALGSVLFWLGTCKSD